MEEKKVDFMIIGVQKCGTTSLSYQLDQHPEIEICEDKEPDFFSRNPDWKSKINEYQRLFKNNKRIKGEASTTYSWYLEFPETAQRLFDYNPNLKLIFIVRDPVERMRSHYMHELSKARTKMPIEKEVLLNPTYLHHSLYSIQIRPFLKLFSKENFHFICFEEYVKNPVQTLESVAEFLNVSKQDFNNIDLKPQNNILERKAEYKIKTLIAPYVRFLPLSFRNLFKKPFTYEIKEREEFSSEFKKILWNYFEDDVKNFEGLSKLDLTHWRLKNGIMK